MPPTARRHFNEDIARAIALVDHSDAMEKAKEPTRLFQDVRLSGVAMVVGAMDAYLCDAYVDCLSAVLQAFVRGVWVGDLPAAYREQKLTAGDVLDASRPHRPLWNIRMAARKLMERDNVLSLHRVPDLFNGVLPSGQKLWTDFVPRLIAKGSKRLTGSLNNAAIAALGKVPTGLSKNDEAEAKKVAAEEQRKATKVAIATFKERIADTVQLRHDWIHNCARPRQAIGLTGWSKAATRAWEVEAFVSELDDHIESHRLA